MGSGRTLIAIIWTEATFHTILTKATMPPNPVKASGTWPGFCQFSLPTLLFGLLMLLLLAVGYLDASALKFKIQFVVTLPESQTLTLVHKLFSRTSLSLKPLRFNYGFIQ